MEHLNRFQLWARDWARAYGFDVQPAGNWVTLHKEGMEPIECMSARGVMDACDGMTEIIKAKVR